MTTSAMIIGLINFWSGVYGVDYRVSQAVAMQESRMNPNTVGLLNEQGLFQLRPEFNKEYTIEQLRDPNTNIMLGIKYLAKMKRECKHRENLDYLVCYNAGPYGARKIKYPSKFKYVVGIQHILAMNEGAN